MIAVPISRVLRGQDKAREAGGTDLSDLHTGEHDGVGHDGDDDDVDDDDNRLSRQCLESHDTPIPRLERVIGFLVHIFVFSGAALPPPLLHPRASLGS